MKIWELNVRAGGVVVVVRSIVLVPMTACVPAEARLSRVSETVIAGPPGASV